MINDYLCPNCKSVMNIENALVFGMKSAAGDRGILFLDTELGNYARKTHPSFQLVEGEEYGFYCPACHAKLNTIENPHLVRVHYRDETGTTYDLLISNIIGEECTYKIRDKTVESYGPDAERYKKYLDLPQEYKKYL